MDRGAAGPDRRVRRRDGGPPVDPRRPERAKDGPFGATIAPRLPHALAPAGDVVRGRAARQDAAWPSTTASSVRFPAPVPSGSRVRGTSGSSGRRADWGLQATMTATIERDGGDKPVCVAELSSATTRLSLGSVENRAQWFARLVSKVHSGSEIRRSISGGARHEARRSDPGSRRRSSSRRWQQDERWAGIERPYTAEEVVRLRGSVVPEHTLARLGAERLWQLLQRRRARARARRADRRPGRADGARPASRRSTSPAGRSRPTRTSPAHTYPDQSLYPANSVPALVRRLNNALLRADQIDWAEGRNGTHWLAPIVADAEAGFGGAAQRVRADEGDDRGGRRRACTTRTSSPSEKKCGHLGGKVLVPTQQFVRTLDRGAAGRRRARRADGARRAHRRAQRRAAHERRRRVRPRLPHRRAHGGGLLPRPRRARRRRSRAASPTRRTPTCSGSRRRRPTSARRASSPRRSTSASPASCSPTTARRRSTGSKHLDDEQIAGFQQQLGELGYRFQFITLAGFHALNAGDVRARARLRDEGMTAYVRAAGARVRAGGRRLHGHAPPARGRRRLLRPRRAGGRRRRQLDARAQGLDRGGAVRARKRARRERRRRSRRPSSRREALEFVERLHRELNPRRLELLGGAASGSAARRRRAAGLPRRDARGPRERLARRAGARRTCVDRRCEITGPVERKMMINALNSGARVFMADFEDASSPTWENVVAGPARTSATRSRRDDRARDGRRRATA